MTYKYPTLTAKTVEKITDIGCDWTVTRYSDGSMQVQDAHQEEDCIDLPKASVDRLARIFREIELARFREIEEQSNTHQ